MYKMKRKNHSTFKYKEEKKAKSGGVSMRKLLNKQLKNEKGLTLIELLAVIVILAIIAAIAIPAIGNIISNSKSKAILSDATQIISSAKTAIADGECGDASKTPVICTNINLEDLVEGITLVGADEVVKTITVATGTTPASTNYSIKYTEFSELNEKYKEKVFGTKTAVTTTAVSDEKLAEAMGNK